MTNLTRCCGRGFVAAVASVFCVAVLSGHPALAGSTGSSDFGYEQSPCPFDTTGAHVEHLQCGWLTVPENRTKDNGRTIKLAVTILKAAGSRGKATPVLLLEDGPGVSAPLHGAMLGTHAAIPGRDLVVLDQRGTGFSQPSLCPWLNPTYAGEMGLPGGYIQALDLSARQAALMRRGALRACRGELDSRSIDPAAYNPIESADDVEALRKALGYRQWNLLGTGYGARVAQIVMRKYPSSVRSAVMLPPEPVDGTALIRDSVAAFADALRRLFALCSKNVECAAAYPHLARSFRRAVTQLRRRPLELTLDSRLLGRSTYVMNAQDFVVLVRLGLSSGGFVGQVPWLIDAVQRRDKTALRPLVAGLMKATVSQSAPHHRFSWGAYYSGRCYGDRATRKQWLDASSAWPNLRLIGFVGSACRAWDAGRASAQPLQPVKSDVPVLAVSGALDPSLPAGGLERMLAGFSNATRVVLPHGTHNPGPHNVHCILGLLRAFYRKPQAAPDTTCVSRLPPLEFKRPSTH